MNTASIVVVLAAVGVNFGWQAAEDERDGYEYIVQIEPELLDALQRGEKVPIESNVPPEVAPIRKVRVVVGRGELPRKTLSGVSRTAYFAGQPAWTPDRYNSVAPAAAAVNDDRYGSPPAVGNRSAVGPPPSILDRAQAAVTETGNTLREGVEAGIQAANEQLSRSGEQVRDSAVDAGQQFGQQLQQWTNDPQRQLEQAGNDLRNATQQTLGAVGNQLQQVTNPFTPATTTPPANRPRGSIAPPPWPVAGSTTAPPWTGTSQSSATDTPPSAVAQAAAPPARASTSWTSIDPNVAGPPLVLPQLATTSRTTNGTSEQDHMVAAGPAFPNSAAITRQPIHSVLTDPSSAGTSQTASDDWATDWHNTAGATKASIERGANANADTQAGAARGSELVPVQPLDRPVQQPQQPQQASNLWSNDWADSDLWSQPPQGSTDSIAQNQQPLAATPTTQPTNSTVPGSSVNSAPLANNMSNLAGPTAVTTDQPPWLPLLVVSLSLMGSLSANVFLGWSYMDARQKYRLLVQKTADTFRRKKPAA
jgi:hypothetical protein